MFQVKLSVVAIALGITAAMPAYQAPAMYQPMTLSLNTYHVEEPPKPYKYGYEVDDGYYNRHHHKEESDAYGAKKGSYGYTNAEGLYRNVEYVADKHGYRAYVSSNEPGVAPQDPADVIMYVKPAPASSYAPPKMPAYQMEAYPAPSYKPAKAKIYSAPMKPAYQAQKMEAYPAPMKASYQPQMDAYPAPMKASYKPQMDSYKPQMDAYKPQMDSYKPQMDAYKPQMDSYKPQMDSYKPQMDSYKPQMDAYPAPMKVSYQPQMDSYHAAPKMGYSAMMSPAGHQESYEGDSYSESKLKLRVHKGKAPLKKSY